MQVADFLSIAILIASAVLAIFKLGKGVYDFFYGDIVLTNPRTGKSVTLGRHHRDGLSKELEEVLE